MHHTNAGCTLSLYRQEAPPTLDDSLGRFGDRAAVRVAKPSLAHVRRFSGTAGARGAVAHPVARPPSYVRIGLDYSHPALWPELCAHLERRMHPKKREQDAVSLC